MTLTTTDSKSNHRIVSVNAMYTGGGIWLFWGKCSDGTYFFGDDDDHITILNTDPSVDWNESLYPEWFESHTIRELHGWERVAFYNAVIDKCEEERSGGFTDIDAECYRIRV